jgi:hypothetical protein
VIPGRFGNTSGRPYVSGRVWLPRFKLSANLSFLVDTGADRSTLMPADALKMGVDYAQLGNTAKVGGMGGNANCFNEQAILIFDELNRGLVRSYVVWLVIPKPKVDLRNMPPILGRDVLDGWYMHYDPSGKGLRFTVRSADHTQAV